MPFGRPFPVFSKSKKPGMIIMIPIPLNLHLLWNDSTVVPTQELEDFLRGFDIDLQAQEIQNSLDSNPVNEKDNKLAVASILKRIEQLPKTVEIDSGRRYRSRPSW